MDRSTAWLTVGQCIHGGRVPAPERVQVLEHSITVLTATCADVDAWASYIGLPTPWLVFPGAYGTVEFYRDGEGWLGASIISVSCENPTETYRIAQEEALRNEERGRVSEQQQDVAT